MSIPRSAIKHRVIFLRINKSYYHGMTDDKIYAVTRGIWPIAKNRRDKAEYAYAVFYGKVVGVFKINPNKWVKASNSKRVRDYPQSKNLHNWESRWEFTKESAPLKNDVHAHINKMLEYNPRGGIVFYNREW